MNALNRIIIFLLAVTIRGGLGDVISDCAGKPADVIFLLDASNSIWRPDFHRQLNFIKSVVEFFTVGPANTMVGVITYALHPQLQFQLNYYSRKTDLYAAIDNIRQDGGYETRTSDALRYLRERGFSASFGARPQVAKVAVIITDGRSDNATLSALEAGKVRDIGVHLFAVGVGRNLDMEELKTLASEPTDHYTFLVDNYHGLERIKDLLAIKTCAVTDPPSTTTTTIKTTTTTPSTTPIPTTTIPRTRRPRRMKTTTATTTTTTTTTTTSSTLESNDDKDDDDDDTDGINGKDGITDPDWDSNDNRNSEFYRNISWSGSSLTGSEDLPPSAIRSDSTGREDFRSPDGNQRHSHPSGSKEWGSSEGEETVRSEFEPGRESDGTGHHRTSHEEHQRIAGGGEGGDGGEGRTSDPDDGNGSPDRRPTLRTPEILDAPIYVPESTEYPYHEFVAHEHRNLDDVQSPGNPPRTSELERGTEDELDIYRIRAPSGPSGGGPEVEIEGSDGNGYGGSTGSGRYTDLGIYSFDAYSRFVRQPDSESLVDADRLPKVPEDGDLLLEDDRIVAVDSSGSREVLGFVVNGTHYIGKWIDDDEDSGRNSSMHGYRASPEITERIRTRDDAKKSHVIVPEKGSDVNQADADTLLTDYQVDTHWDIVGKRRRPNKAVDSEEEEVEQEDRESETEVLDPHGRRGYWDEGEDGKMVWFQYTCPGVYVPVPDVQLDDSGKPMINGHSQCGERTEGGAEYVYVSPGRFEKVVPTSGPGVPGVSGVSGVPGASSEPDDDGRFHEFSSKEEASVWGDGQGSDVDRPGTWTIDVDGSVRPIQGELVDLDLPKIDEDQAFYVKENIIWTKDNGGDKLKPVGCIINGTYYVGYFIRKDDGTKMLYGYPSKALERKLSRDPPTELTHLPRRLRDPLPAAEAREGGHWAVDENGVLSWYSRLGDDNSPDDRQEFRIGGHGQPEEDLSPRTPDPEVLVSGTDEPEVEDKPDSRQRETVVDSDGRSGKWRPGEEGEWVWHRYVCPGVYVPVPKVPAPGEEVPPNECTAKDENGEETKYEYESPGKFKKVPKEKDTRDMNDINNIDKPDEDSNDIPGSKGPDKEEEEEEEEKGDEKERRSLQTPVSEDSHPRVTLKPFQINAPTTERIKSSPNGHKEKTNGKSSNQKGCKPRKSTDLAFIIDSKRGDEESADRMWNLTGAILSKLDLEAVGADGDRMFRVRFVQECGSGTAGLDLGAFESKEALVNALDSIIDAPQEEEEERKSPAQLITNMAAALSRDEADDEADDSSNRRRHRRRHRRRRRVGVYVTDGTSAAAMEETVEAAQRAKHDGGVEMFTVGLGHRTSPTELRAVASCDVARHYYAMNHHSKADAVAAKIAKVICLGR